MNRTDDDRALPSDYGSDIRVIAHLRERNAKLVAALEAMLVDPPATLDEPDMDWEVIWKMRDIAREALAQQSTEKP